MKNKLLLFLILLSFIGYSQNPLRANYGIQITGGQPTVTSVNFLTTTDDTAQGLQGKIAPINLPIPYVPVNYSTSNQSIGQHLTGIDTRLGQISSTTAGITQRVYFTADNVTVTAGTFFSSSLLGKGSTASGSPPALVLADNTKAYFTKDLISIAQPSNTIGYAGTYSGILTVSASPTPVATQQRFTIEIYRTNNGGTPIASGVSGAPTGDLGVTVLAILDSGIINLTAGSITNVPVSGILTQNIIINTGERLRYHVSAAKIGTGGGNVTFGVYYGNSYNSYYDVPVAVTTDAVLNKSVISGVTSSDALNTLNATKANDSDALHKSGNETFTGIKTSVNTGATQINGLDLTNDGTTGTQVVFITNNQMGAGLFFRNLFSGQGLSGDNANIGSLVNLNSRTASTGNLIRFTKNNVATTTFDHNGILNAAGIVGTNETASTIASFDASKNLKSLATATYPNLTELSYVKGVTSSIQSQLNAKATDANVIHKTLDEVKTGSLTLNSLILPENVTSSTIYRIGQVMSINDYWNIYGSSAVTDRGDLVFEIGDNGLPGITGQRFRFYIKSGSSGVDKDPLVIEYDKITATTDITSSQTVTGQSLAVDTGALLFPTNTAYGGTGNPLILRSSNKLGFRSSITSNSQLLFNTDALSSDQTVTWSNVSGTVAVTLNGSASLDFPSTGAGLSSELTISVTGAADGDTVVLGIPNASSLSNTCYTARVSSDNTVSVKFNNYSSASVDPNTGTFKVKIIK